jgi:predicted dehydrogenase
MRRDPDVRQEFAERAGSLTRIFAAMDSVRIKTPIDIDSRWFDKTVAEINQRQGSAPGIVFGDFRGMLDDIEVDKLVVGSPDHWHAIPTILGSQAGKPIDVEKPNAHNRPHSPQSLGLA